MNVFCDILFFSVYRNYSQICASPNAKEVAFPEANLGLAFLQMAYQKQDGSSLDSSMSCLEYCASSMSGLRSIVLLGNP
jgi:hypothetical protein